MSAYRILGPGGAERRRPDALWAAVGPATQLQAGELVPLNYGAGSSAAAPRVVLVWVQAAIPSIVGLPAPTVTRHDLAPRCVPDRLRVDEYPIEVEHDCRNPFTHRQIGSVSLLTDQCRRAVTSNEGPWCYGQQQRRYTFSLLSWPWTFQSANQVLLDDKPRWLPTAGRRDQAASQGRFFAGSQVPRLRRR